MNEKLSLLDIDEIVTKKPSFMKIMEDGIVTDEELQEQSERVLAMMREAENRFNKEDLAFIKELTAETNVLYAIYHYYELQNL